MRRAVLITSLLLAAGCSGSRVGKVSISPDLVKLIPAGTVSLAGGRMEAVRSTEVYKKYYTSRRLPLLDNLRSSTGVDPGADLNEFLTASTGRDSLTAVLAASPEALKKMDRGGSGSAVIQDRIGVIGPAAQIAQVAKGPQEGVIPAELRKLIEEIPSNPHFWAVSARPRLPAGSTRSGAGMLGGVGRLFTSMDSTVMWVNLSDSVQFGAIAHCSDEESAKQVQSAAQALIGLARLASSRNQPDAAKVLDAIEIKQEKSMVRFNATLPPDQLENLANLTGR